MIDALIVGINSRIGQSVYKCAEDAKVNITCGIDVDRIGEFKCPVYNSLDQVKNDVDVIISFDEKSLSTVIPFALKKNCALVLGDFVLTEKINKLVKEASTSIPIFTSSNFSIAVNLIAKFASETAKQFGCYDVEIIDFQASSKPLSPSGTTKLFVENIKEAKGEEYKLAHGRKGQGKRSEKEIGVHSVRGGNLIGSHKVMFIGPDETICFEHIPSSRDLYAKGALSASRYILTKSAGLYTMKDY